MLRLRKVFSRPREDTGDWTDYGRLLAGLDPDCAILRSAATPGDLAEVVMETRTLRFSYRFCLLGAALPEPQYFIMLARKGAMRWCARRIAKKPGAVVVAARCVKVSDPTVEAPYHMETLAVFYGFPRLSPARD